MSKLWVKAAMVRAVKTMAQTAVALMSTGAVGILDVDWMSVVSASALAGVLSLLTSLAGLPEVELLEGQIPDDEDELDCEGCEYDCMSAEVPDEDQDY